MGRHPPLPSKQRPPWGAWLSSSSSSAARLPEVHATSTIKAARLRRLVLLLFLLLLPALHFMLGLLLGRDRASATTPTPTSTVPFLETLMAWSPSSLGLQADDPGRRSEVAIVMVDTRDLLAVPEYQWYEEVKLDPFWYGQISTAMNHEYACEHGYDFLFYHIHPEPNPTASNSTAAGSSGASHFLDTPLEGEIQSQEGFDRHYLKTEGKDKYEQGCRSPADGGQLRSSPWCKVAVLDRVLQLGYRYAVVIDTDALFLDFNLTIPALLDQYVDPTRRVGRGGHAGVFIANDKPFRENRLNTGFMVGEASPEAQRFLRAWWDTPSGEWLTRSPFEQELLNLEREAGNNSALLENGEGMSLSLTINGPHNAQGDLQVVGYRVLNPHNLPALHITNYDRFLRDQLFALLYAKHKIIRERRHQRFTHACPPPRRVYLDGAKEPIRISDTPYPAAAAAGDASTKGRAS